MKLMAPNLETGIAMLSGLITAREQRFGSSLVLIGGPTAAGKSTLVERLASGVATTLLSLDRYYLGADACQQSDGTTNFSLPTALDQDLIKTDLALLEGARNGDQLTVPTYSFTEGRRTGTEPLIVAKRRLVDGIYAIASGEDLANAVLVYVDAPIEAIYERKRKRDCGERGVSQDDFEQRWNDFVLPAIEEFVKRQMDQATLVIHNV